MGKGQVGRSYVIRCKHCMRVYKHGEWITLTNKQEDALREVRKLLQRLPQEIAFLWRSCPRCQEGGE